VVLIAALVAVVVVAGMVAVVLLRRRSYDDVHSVEHYHRQLHTLEEMREHTAPAPDSAGGAGKGASGASGASAASGVAEASATSARTAGSGSSTVRLTDRDQPVVPPPPPPSVPESAARVRFDDTAPAEDHGDGARTAFPHPDDKAMHSIERPPWRLGTFVAIGVVVVLVAVLIVTGLHSTTPTHHRGSSTATTTAHTPSTVSGHTGSKAAGHGAPHHGHGAVTTTTTTAAPAVSAPSAVTARGATYQVSASAYSLSLAASSGECWVEATNPSTNAVLFSGTLLSGQSHIVAATGPVTVIAGAPGAFVATVNGVPVTLPTGSQAPFTLTFLTAQPAAGGASTSSVSTTTTTAA
jgi:hypothetical protein